MKVIKYLEKPKLKSPILVEGLPGIGNVGRISASYLVEKLKAKKFAEFYSSDFFPSVIVNKDGIARLMKIEFYYYKGKNDIIIVVGDSQAMTPEGYYNISEGILEVAEKFNVKMIITLGGLGKEEVAKSPRIVGAVNDEKLIKKFKKYDIIFEGDILNTIVGVSGLLVGMAKIKNIDAICLLAETSGFPIVIADPIGAEALLRTLSKILEIEIDLSELTRDAKELEKKLIKTEEMQRKMLEKILGPEEEKKDLEYIG
jgi:uncharacterized protein (TIGR00162 family)